MPNKATRKAPQYPKAQGSRSGCKVSFLYYTSEADAKLASVEAEREAARMFALGYDFGYVFPGDIRQPTAEGPHAEMYEVVIP